MMFTYAELPSGKSNLTVLREPGGSGPALSVAPGSSASDTFPCSGLGALCPHCLSKPQSEEGLRPPLPSSWSLAERWAYA